MSPDQDINNSQASAAWWASPPHRWICAHDLLTPKQSCHSKYPPMPSWQLIWAQPADICRIERGGIIVVWSKWKLWISLLWAALPTPGQAIFGTQSCPGLRPELLTLVSSQLMAHCAAQPGLADQSFLSKLQCLPLPGPGLLMLHDVSQCIKINSCCQYSVYLWRVCWIFGDIGALRVIVRHWIEN